LGVKRHILGVKRHILGVNRCILGLNRCILGVKRPKPYVKETYIIYKGDLYLFAYISGLDMVCKKKEKNLRKETPEIYAKKRQKPT